jgi:hypothetical protein
MDYTTAAVYTFQKRVLENIKQHLPSPKKVIYFMDGAARQYKNKNNSNLAHNEEYYLRSRMALLHYFSWKGAM